MSWNEIIYGLGELILESFALLRVGGNAVNVLIIIVGSIMMIWWILQMKKFGEDNTKWHF